MKSSRGILISTTLLATFFCASSFTLAASSEENRMPANYNAAEDFPDPLAACKAMGDLQMEKSKIEKEKKELEQQRNQLAELRRSVEEKIVQLEEIEKRLQQKMEQLDKSKSKKLKRLATIYEGMKPEQAAKIIEKMDLSSIVEILAYMDEKKVGKLLSFVPPALGVKISQSLADLKE